MTIHILYIRHPIYKKMNDIWNNISYNIDLIPSPEMTDNERLNCLTRFVLIITVILYSFVPRKPHWLYFLSISMISIVILWYTNRYISKSAKVPVKN